MNASKDWAKTSMIQTVCSQRLMKLLTKCPLLQLFLTNNKEFSVVMVELDPQFRILKVLSRFRGQSKSNSEATTLKTTKKFLTCCGVILMKLKKKMGSSTIIRGIRRNKTILLDLAQTI